MKFVTAFAVACLTLTGCAAQVVSSNSRSVVVDAGKRALPIPSSRTPDAQRLADAECAKHGRVAKMVGRPDDRSNEYVFDCVQ